MAQPLPAPRMYPHPKRMPKLPAWKKNSAGGGEGGLWEQWPELGRPASPSADRGGCVREGRGCTHTALRPWSLLGCSSSADTGRGRGPSPETRRLCLEKILEGGSVSQHCQRPGRAQRPSPALLLSFSWSWLQGGAEHGDGAGSESGALLARLPTRMGVPAQKANSLCARTCTSLAKGMFPQVPVKEQSPCIPDPGGKGERDSCHLWQ